MKVNNVDYNFDRVVQLILVSADGSRVVLEYNPLADERNIARIDFEVSKLGPSDTTTNGPGHKAEFRLYNITDSVASLLFNNGYVIGKVFGAINSKNIATIIAERKKRDKEVKRSKPRIELYVGYANHEDKQNPSLTLLYSGYLNSSYSYREGQDQVTVLMSWPFDTESTNDVSWSNIPQAPSETDFEADETDEVSLSRKRYTGTFLSILKDLIMDYYPDAPSELVMSDSFASSFISNNEKNTGVSMVLREPMQTWKEDHKYLDGFKTPVYVYGKEDHGTNAALAKKIEGTLGSNWSYDPNGERDWNKIKSDFCARTKMNIGIYIDTDVSRRVLDSVNKLSAVEKSSLSVLVPSSVKTEQFFRVYVYPLVSSASSKGNKAGRIVITNYQNVVEPPMLQGGSVLQVKTMMIPQARPEMSLMLELKDLVASEEGITDNLMPNIDKTAVGTLSMNAELAYGSQAPLVTGSYAASVLAAEKEGKGYIYNRNWNIFKVVFEGSTHKKQWYSTFYTYPSYMGGAIADKGGTDA